MTDPWLNAIDSAIRRADQAGALEPDVAEYAVAPEVIEAVTYASQIAQELAYEKGVSDSERQLFDQSVTETVALGFIVRPQ
jgi:hypothetical protein